MTAVASLLEKLGDKERGMGRGRDEEIKAATAGDGKCNARC